MPKRMMLVSIVPIIIFTHFTLINLSVPSFLYGSYNMNFSSPLLLKSFLCVFSNLCSSWRSRYSSLLMALSILGLALLYSLTLVAFALAYGHWYIFVDLTESVIEQPYQLCLGVQFQSIGLWWLDCIRWNQNHKIVCLWIWVDFLNNGLEVWWFMFSP